MFRSSLVDSELLFKLIIKIKLDASVNKRTIVKFCSLWIKCRFVKKHLFFFLFTGSTNMIGALANCREKDFYNFDLFFIFLINDSSY